MNHLFVGASMDGAFRIVLAALQAAAYGALTVAAALGFTALRAGAAEARLQRANLAWMRAGFLLLAAGQIAHGTWTTFAWGEFWTWDPAKNLGLVVWLLYGGVLHMHHVPTLRGRRVALASVAAWGLMAAALAALHLALGPRTEAAAPASQEMTTPSRHAGP